MDEAVALTHFHLLAFLEPCFSCSQSSWDAWCVCLQSTPRARGLLSGGLLRLTCVAWRRLLVAELLSHPATIAALVQTQTNIIVLGDAALPLENTNWKKERNNNKKETCWLELLSSCSFLSMTGFVAKWVGTLLFFAPHQVALSAVLALTVLWAPCCSGEWIESPSLSEHSACPS